MRSLVIFVCVLLSMVPETVGFVRQDRVHFCLRTCRTAKLCPVLNDDIDSSCNSTCEDSSDCSSGLKCCNNGCGMECMEPEGNGLLFLLEKKYVNV